MITDDEWAAVVAVCGPAPLAPESWHTAAGQRVTLWRRWLARAQPVLEVLRAGGDV